jgi:hypothetical protein
MGIDKSLADLEEVAEEKSESTPIQAICRADG